MKTLLLDSNWDLTIKGGKIAVADGPYAIAQDVASAVRLFRGELWYDTRPGVPYFQNILGDFPPRGFLVAKFNEAALTVPGVMKIRVELNPITSARVLSGQIRITDNRGTVSAVIMQSGLPWYINAAVPSTNTAHLTFYSP
jgi:hypothetical protein